MIILLPKVVNNVVKIKPKATEFRVLLWMGLKTKQYWRWFRHFLLLRKNVVDSGTHINEITVYFNALFILYNRFKLESNCANDPNHVWLSLNVWIKNR